MRICGISELIRIRQRRPIKYVTRLEFHALFLLSIFVLQIVLSSAILLTLTVHKTSVLFNVRGLLYDWTTMLELWLAGIGLLASEVAVGVEFFELVFIVNDGCCFYHVVGGVWFFFEVVLVFVDIFYDFFIFTLYILYLFFQILKLHMQGIDLFLIAI